MSELEPTRTYSNPTATEVLRRMLDERGVEWEGGKRSLRWRDRYGVMMQAFPLANGELGMGVWSCTPEQAIAATLGTGTCELVNAAEDLGQGTSSCMCFECGYTALDDWWDEFNYCPNCGRRIVEPTTNDVGAEVVTDGQA